MEDLNLSKEKSVNYSFNEARAKYLKIIFGIITCILTGSLGFVFNRIIYAFPQWLAVVGLGFFLGYTFANKYFNKLKKEPNKSHYEVPFSLGPLYGAICGFCVNLYLYDESGIIMLGGIVGTFIGVIVGLIGAPIAAAIARALLIKRVD
jgi:hypothetical protein